MARTLAQVIGVEKHLRKKDNEVGTSLKKKVQVPALVTGRTKTFRPKNDDLPPEQHGHDEYQQVALTVEDALKEAGGYSAAALNVVATKDRTNQAATANLEYRGAILVRDVPISHLLFLGDYLTEWRTFLAVLPVLDPARKWEEDEGREGLWKSAVEVTDRNLPSKVPVVLYPHTDKHAAQVQLVDQSVHVGWFDNQILSGAVTQDRKKKLLDNCDDLIAAAKDAIARANKTEAISEETEGPALMAALLA
jgi:hypothetical protein